MALEELSYKGPEGCIAHGQHINVIQGLAGGTTARKLLASESGSLCMFDSAAGQIYTLPAPVVGMYFDFLITVTATSNGYSIDTDAATTFIGGGLGSFSTTVAEGGDFFPATIASTVSCDFDSDVTGQLIGTSVRVVALSTTTWGMSGHLSGVGTLATPFA